jgi:MerR family transcriptional regulator/heat shock protein HspR
MGIDDKPLFTLSVAAEIMGVHPRTLMIYENEGLVIPQRTKTNRRRYSQKDIRKLQFIRFLTQNKGVNLAGVETIIKLIKDADKKGLRLQELSFPDFPHKPIL